MEHQPVTKQEGAGVSSEKNGGSHVLSMTIRNFMRINFARIKLNKRGITRMGGKEGQGKTSISKGFLLLMGGKEFAPKEAVRRGTDKAELTLKCDGPVQFQIHRTIDTKGAFKYDLKNLDGTPLKDKPLQEFLNGLVGESKAKREQSFDPSRFVRMTGKERMAVLFDLVPGLEDRLIEINEERQKVFNERTDVSHNLRNYTGELEEMDEPPPDAPTELVSTKELVDEKNERQRILTLNNADRRQLTEKATACRELKDKIGGLKAELTEAENEYAESLKDNEFLTGKVNALTDPDMDEIDDQIATATETNTKAIHAQAYREKLEKRDNTKAKQDELSEKMEKIDEHKAQILSNAKFPITGLSFGGEDVRYNDTLFDNLGGSERWRVAAAIGMALHEDKESLRFFIMDEVGDVGEESMDIINKMAHEKNFQVLAIRLNTDGADYVIEDGQVKEAVEA